MVTIYCRSFAFKNETDFTSILSQYLCKMAVRPDYEIRGHLSTPAPATNCQKHVKITDLLCGFWPDSVYYVAKSSSLIPKVAVHVRDFGRHECYHECYISTHQFPPQSVRITDLLCGSWPDIVNHPTKSGVVRGGLKGNHECSTRLEASRIVLVIATTDFSVLKHYAT